MPPKHYSLMFLKSSYIPSGRGEGLSSHQDGSRDDMSQNRIWLPKLEICRRESCAGELDTPWLREERVHPRRGSESQTTRSDQAWRNAHEPRGQARMNDTDLSCSPRPARTGFEERTMSWSLRSAGSSSSVKSAPVSVVSWEMGSKWSSAS